MLSCVSAGVRQRRYDSGEAFSNGLDERSAMAGHGRHIVGRLVGGRATKVQTQFGILVISDWECALDSLGPARSRFRPYLSPGISWSSKRQRGHQEQQGIGCL